jgi:zinc finger protein
MAPDNLFPSIGTIAQQADSAAETVDIGDTCGSSPNDDDDRVVQEIESLCMNCEEQVSTNLSMHYLLMKERYKWI